MPGKNYNTNYGKSGLKKSSGFKMNGWSPFTSPDEDADTYKLGLTALGEDPKDVHIEKLKQKAIDNPWGYKAKGNKYHHFYDDGECIGCTIQELKKKKK